LLLFFSAMASTHRSLIVTPDLSHFPQPELDPSNSSLVGSDSDAKSDMKTIESILQQFKYLLVQKFERVLEADLTDHFSHLTSDEVRARLAIYRKDQAEIVKDIASYELQLTRCHELNRDLTEKIRSETELLASLDVSSHKSSGDLALCGRSIRELAERKQVHGLKMCSLERTWNDLQTMIRSL
ncbi:hypothetical protein A2U01_0006056, partial [Trifolium medium]|nr:hypothetical protein [Trifolium medium]